MRKILDGMELGVGLALVARGLELVTFDGWVWWQLLLLAVALRLALYVWEDGWK